MNQFAGATELGQARPRPTRTSEMLRDFTASLTTERVTLGEIVSGLGHRGLGVLIAVFSLPNILPSTVPFGNVATGIPPLIFALQLTFGGPGLILPRFIAKRTIATSTLNAIVPRVATALSWFERLLTPRLAWVTGPSSKRAIGAICVLLAFVCTLPIPFAHQLPALGLVLIGLGLIERDGLAILIGSAIGILSTVLLGLVVFGLAKGFGHALHFFMQKPAA